MFQELKVRMCLAKLMERPVTHQVQEPSTEELINLLILNMHLCLKLNSLSIVKILTKPLLKS